MKQCPICRGPMVYRFSALVVGRHEGNFDLCTGCGLLQARDPSWLEEAYSSPISALDTGLVARNLGVAQRLDELLSSGLRHRSAARYVDFAGGYGLLTRLMRDRGFDFYWLDRYAPNLLARGFEYQPALGPCDAVTAFELLEHVPDPVLTASEALDMGQSSLLITTTELFRGEPPAPDAWWYYAFQGGQHISFFTKDTLVALGKRLGLQCVSVGGFHLFSRQPLCRSRLSLAFRWPGRLLSRIRAQVRPSKMMEDHHLLAARLRAAGEATSPGRT